jgi:hypothetical protein
MEKTFLWRKRLQSVVLLRLTAGLRVASSVLCCENTCPVLLASQVECLEDRILDTLVPQQRYHCRETSVPGKTGRHFYVSANLSFPMDEFR